MKRSVRPIPIFLILALIVLTLVGIRTISTPKIWAHISAGQAIASQSKLLAASQDPFCFTTAGEKWISTTPVYDRLMFAMADAPAAITLTHVAAVTGAFILLLAVARKWGNSLSQAVALFLCTIMLVPMFDPAPIFFGMFFYALALFLLRPVIKAPIRWLILIPAQILWTNMHPTFILGPIICLLAAIEAGLKTKGKKANNDSLKELSILAVVLLVATIFNQRGLKLHIYLIKHATDLMLPDLQSFISPFSSGFKQPAMRQLLTLALFLGAGGLITLKKQLPLVLTTLAIISAFFMIRSLHFTVFFTFLAFPFLVLSMQSIGEAVEHTIEPLMGDKIHWLKRTTQTGLALFLACAAWGVFSNNTYAKIGSASRFGLGFQKKAIPEAVAELLNHRSFPKKVLNLPYDGSYLSYKFPDKKFHSDLRGELFDAAKHADLLAALTGDAEKWKELQSEHVPQAMVLNCFSNESAQILRTFLRRHWNLCFFDGSYAVLLSPSKRYEKLSQLTQLKNEGLKSLNAELEAYSNFGSGLIRPANSPQLIGAGNTFLALNRFAEAKAVYSTLLNTNPSMRSAWIGYGQSMLGLKELEEATVALERATQLMPRSGYALLNLQRAYQLAGNTEKAERIQARLDERFKPE